MGTSWRRLMLVAMVTLAGLGLACTAASGATTSGETTASHAATATSAVFPKADPRCSTALGMARRGLPESAAELIDTVRKQTKNQDACLRAAGFARRAIGKSARVLNGASRWAAELPDEPRRKEDVQYWKDVLGLAQQAQGLNSENEQGAALAKTAKTALDDYKASTDRSVTGTLTDHSTSWKDFFKSYSDDYGTLGGIAVGTFGLVLLLARLLLLCPQPKPRELKAPDWLKSRRRRNLARLLLLLGLAAMAAAAYWAGGHARLSFDPSSLAGWAALAAVAVVIGLLSLRRSMRKRILTVLADWVGADEDRAANRYDVPIRLGHPALATSLSLVAAVVLVTVELPAALDGLAWSLGTESLEGWVWTALVAAALVVAVLCMWSWLFHRQRVRIDMQKNGEPSTAGAASIVAHLRALGAAPPKGLEIPLGVDSTTLSGSNIKAGVAGFLGKVVLVLQTALAITPWRVLVDKDSDDEIDVVITRHGRVRDSVAIRTKPLGKDGPSVDFHKMVAARVLMTLLTARGTYQGLSGARDWQSIGLQYEADRRSHPDRAERLALLARAVELDPRNWFARMSYRMELDSHSDRPERLEALSKWLAKAAGEGDLDEALRARMLLGAYAMRLNYRVAAGLPLDGDDAALPGLKEKLQRAAKSATLDVAWRKRLKQVATATTDPDEKLETAAGPQAAYALACHYAQRSTALDREKAVELLRFAFNMPEVKENAATDPTLKGLKESDEYRNEFGADPRSELTEVAPFTRYKRPLELYGLPDPGDLASYPRVALSQLLQLTAAQTKDLQRRAEVVLMVPDGLAKYRFEIADALASLGVVSPSDLDSLRTSWERRDAARTAIRNACIARNIPDPDPDAFDSWLPG